MTAQERKAALANLQNPDVAQPCMTGIPLLYHGERKTFDAYEIPLDYLVYNKLNGRIGSIVKTFERQNHTLDPENPEDIKIIEKFLWESKEDANKKTRASLLDDHQQKYGIVTAEGIIIDGNRRASLLNSIRRDDSIAPNKKQHCNYFIAIILPIDADRKEILRLETTYQMGEDAKVDYNPIEKYLKCKDLYDEGFTRDEIASFMGETKPNGDPNPSMIDMYLGVLKLMDEYLQNYHYDGMYTLLDKNEDSFQKLYSALKGYASGSVASMWDFDPEIDTNDLKLIAFDYIRSGFDQTDFRNIITKPSAGNPNRSFFGCQDIWNSFRDFHFEQVDPITDAEESVDEIISNANGADVTRLLRARDNSWQKKVGGIMLGNYNRSKDKLDNKQASDNPLKLLQKALDVLESIDTEQQSFRNDAKVKQCVKEISSLIWDYKKMLE